jgi:hypothetical protein
MLPTLLSISLYHQGVPGVFRDLRLLRGQGTPILQRSTCLRLLSCLLSGARPNLSSTAVLYSWSVKLSVRRNDVRTLCAVRRSV